MVSLFPSSQIKGEMTPFIGKERSLFLVNFQCGIASHKGKKILSLKMWGLQICLSSIKFMSVMNMNNEVKRKCEK